MSWIGRARVALGLGSGSRQAAWGDGFVEEGWDGLSGTVTWDTIDADELVFLVPGLPRSHPLPAEAVARLLPLVVAARQRIDAAPEPGPMGRATRAVLSRSAAVLTGTAGADRDAALLAASILGFETGLNGAYVVASADLLGETLAACAWAGIVCRGRDAVLPGVLAPPLRDALEASEDLLERPTFGDAYGSVAALLGWHLRVAGLAGPLGRALRAIETQGRAVLVTGARTRPAPRVALPPALAAALDSIPDWSVPAPGDVRDAVGGRN